MPSGTPRDLPTSDRTDLPHARGASPVEVIVTAGPNVTDVGLLVELYASASGGVAPYNYTWRFSDGAPTMWGVWANRSFQEPGIVSAWVWANDSQGDSGAGSANVTVSPPMNAGIGIEPEPADAGELVQLTAYIYGGAPPVQVQWNFGDGTTGAGDLVNHTYAASGTYIVRLFANDSVGAMAHQQENLVVDPALARPTLTAASTVLDLGEGLHLNASAQQGSPPYNYTYLGLPQGCNQTWASQLDCVPNETGNFAVSALVADGAGANVSADVGIYVASDPSIVGFVASPRTVTEGKALSLVFTPEGGVGGYRVSYAGLPGGCASSNTTDLQCVPSSPGNFSVVVSAKDGRGYIATAAAPVTVLGLKGPSSNSSGSSGSGGGGTTSHTSGGTNSETVLYEEMALGVGALAVGLALLFLRLRGGRTIREQDGSRPVPPGKRSPPRGTSQEEKSSPGEEEMDAPVD